MDVWNAEYLQLAVAIMHITLYPLLYDICRSTCGYSGELYVE